ncbi:MAG: tetratricopeptide repeat protein [Candidatus Hodarchaeota archaeon]
MSSRNLTDIVKHVTDLIEEKRLEEAAIELEQAIAEFDSEPLLYTLLGKIRMQLGNHEEAIKLLLTASERNPDDLQNWSWLGESYQELDRLEEAEDAYGRALEIDPDDFRSLMGMGLVLKKLEKNEESEAAYLRAYVINPNDIECLSILGLTELIKGEYVTAEGWLRKAIEVNPSHFLPWGSLSVVLGLMGREEEQKEAWDRFEELTGTSIDDEND